MLKKAFFLLLAFVVIVVLWATNCVPLFKEVANKYELYISEHSSNALSVEVQKHEFPFVKNVTGESCKIAVEKFCLVEFFEDFNGEILFIEQTEEGVSYYGYSPLIKYRKQLRGEIINLHVFISKEQVTVGSPIIYGSF